MKKAIMSVLTVWILVNVGLFCLILFSPSIEVQVSAATIIVDDDGTPGVDCNYTTIQEGIDAASPGDTVFVKIGTYYENVIANKTITLNGEYQNTTIIHGGGSGDVLRITADWVNVTGYNLTTSGPNSGDAGIDLHNVNNCSIIDVSCKNNSLGIYLSNSHYNIITNNSVTDNEYGIYFGSSNGNNITENNIHSNDIFGIRIYSSEYNNITGNNASSNGHFGITLLRSTNHTISANEMMNNGINLFGEYIEQWNTHSINTLNSVNGKPVYFIKNQNGGKVPIGAGQVILSNCTNVTVEDQKCIKGSTGILLGFSSDCNLTNNNVSSNIHYGLDLYKSFNNTIINNIASYNRIGMYLDFSEGNSLIRNNISDNVDSGIWLYHSHYNKIIFNNITRNFDGIYLEEFFGSSNYNSIIGNTILSNQNYGLYFDQALYNEVYHNNIINNTNQANDFMGNNDWDASYPLGGNYWSDYSGVDNFKGPNQDIPGNDGIGDTSFWRDNYPLMKPYSPKPLENYTILKQGWNLISIPLIQQNETLKKVLEMINGWYDAVQWYDPLNDNKPWKHLQVSKPFGNDLSHLNETMAFWIHITNPGDTIFLYNGTQPTSNQSIPLHPGWNMVGYPSLTNRNRTAALNNLTFGLEVDAVWTFNNANKNWEEIQAGDYFEVGRGYWVHATMECVWEVSI